ncbi:unnamed protein product [Caenorhabditis auriculariae]|uniref:EGF-like domain-containing protein n=1 Tax=Caenorhabditis auriculariae TaxID=2777116 RepID=A0A8S1HR79_9PELO|nr:unnamed protein product [Caenorhabditis auriculariae]
MRQEGSSDTTSSTTTMPTSSSSNTNPPSARMENGVKIPVLAVGTYHRKPAAPILSVAELAALPKPTSDERNFASRSEGESNSSEMRGPPPAWQPPRPPGKAPDHDYTNDYEDPEDMAKQRDLSRDLLLKTTSAFNSYEMSLSQQRRSAEASSRELMAPPMESWSAEPAVLHKNSDGAYYIPSGSLRTTSSTLSPTSVTTGTTTRYHEPPHALGAPSTFSDASATLLKYPNTTVSVTQARRRQVKMPSVEKKDKPVYRKFSLCSILLCISLLLALLVISLLLLRAPSYVYTEPSPSAVGDSVSRYQDLGLRALPSMISLGEQIHADFLPKHMANTELFIARSARVAFNVTVGSGAQLVLLTRAGAPPSLSLHDELFSLRADRMGVERNPTHQIEEKRSKRSVSAPLPHYQILSPRSGTFEQFMLEGRHFLMFINERNRVEPLAFVAAVTTPSPSSRQHKSGEGTAATTTACESNCNNRGECVDGKCKCVGGYTGDACEEAICPVVCSGNGVFSGGVCVCRAGFKGKECDVRSNWCEVPDCNGRGVCGDEGKCRCEFGWTGDSCEKKACTHPTCNDRGVCVNGTCYCLDGWQGVDCHTFVDVTVRKEASETTEAPRKAQSENAVKKSNKPEAAAFDSTRKKEDPPVKTPFSSSTFNESVQLSIEKDCVDEDCVCDSFEKCSAVVCSGCANGHCDEAGVCYCWKGWTGTACDVEMCSVGCSDHGKCRDDGTCECDKGWNGDNCFEQGCPNDCSQRGECTRKIGERWSCDCQVGRRGDDCAIPVELHCDDGLDNDNVNESDGFVDCDDPECCESESCATESVCSTSPSPSEVLLRMPPVLNAHFDQRINFLIKEKSVQVYTDPNQFNETLVSVVRGRVMWNGGSDKETKSKVPLAGVRVWDASHPLYGFTLTRSDGYFDLVVNGGRSIGLQFLRTPFHSVKKNVYVSTHVISHIDDVVIGREKTQTAELPPRAKCTPATRQIGDVVMKSSWQCASDGVVVRTGDEWIGSRLVVDTRSIVEQIPIPGSSLNLVYDSSRVPATNSTLIIGILGVDIDVELRLVHLIIDVAGRHFEFKLAPKVNLTHVFAWDRMNAYRQSEHGVTSVFVRIGFEYRGCSRESEIVWISRRTEMMGATSRKMEGTSWTIDVHHFFDVVNHIVELGNGGVRMLENDEQRVETALGQDEVKRDIDCGEKCGGSAEKVSLFRPTALAFALDGSLIVGDHNLIRRVAPDGTVNTILTLGLADTSHSYYIAVNPVDGTVAISLPLHKQVLKIVSLTPSDPRNNEEVIAGDGTTCASAVDSCGDGGLALNAQLIFNKGVSYDRDGTLYLADSRRIRIVDVSGHIRSIGDASPDSNPGCHFYMRLANLQLEWPTSVSVDPSSNTIYVLDSNIVYEIEPAHDIARIVLGSPTSCTNSSSQIPLRHARDIAVAPDGSLYIVESDAKRINQLRRLSPDRAAISLVAGGVSPCSCDVPTCGCDDSNSLLAVAARNAHLNSPSSVAINAAGVVFLADSANGKVKRVFVRGARYDPHSRTYKVTAGEKNEAYIFNRHGLHLSTVSLLSGKSVLNFTYNIDSSLGKLVSIQGSGGLSLRLLRDNDTHVNIEAPNGESLRLFMSAYDGLLETVQHGVKDSISLNYQGRGLLHSRVDTEKAVVFGYDDFGRARSLRRDGENWELAEEKIIQGRISTQVRLNGVPFADVKNS